MCNVITRELVIKGHAAAVLLFDPCLAQVVLVEQFRIGALEHRSGPWLLELVAGYIEAGEASAAVVRRESQEEAGCDILDLIPIYTYYVSPGGSSETMALYCGRVDASQAGGIFGLVEEGEDIKVCVLSLEEAIAEIGVGRIDSAAPIIALQWLEKNRQVVGAIWQNSEA